jgi:hypothetical protein
VTDQRPAVPDPMAMWRDWVAQSERQWNAFFNEVMGTDQYTQTMSRFTDMYVSGQKSLGEAMGRYFTALNVATRTDVLALGERLVAIEDRLAALDTTLRSSPQRDEPRSTPTSVARPPRTKKPPSVGERTAP